MKKQRQDDESHCGRPDPLPPAMVQTTGGIDDRQSQQACDLSQASDWVEAWRETMLDRWRGGLLELNGQVTEDAAKVGVSYQYSLIEYRILGYTGSAITPLRRGAIGGNSGPVTHRLEELDCFTAIAVEARKIIDGAAGSAVFPTAINIQVIARFIRS